MTLKKSFFTILSIFYITTVGFGQHIARLDKSEITATDLDKKIDTLMKMANVQGLAVTVFNHHKPIYQKSFGYKSLLTKEPINNNTNFYGSFVLSVRQITVVTSYERNSFLFGNVPSMSQYIVKTYKKGALIRPRMMVRFKKAEPKKNGAP